jgi:hypothetical protein
MALRFGGEGSEGIRWIARRGHPRTASDQSPTLFLIRRGRACRFQSSVGLSQMC